MQRRGESEQPVKGRRSRASRPRARKSPATHLSAADLQEKLDQRTRERDEAPEQLAATTEVLQVISSFFTTRPAGEGIGLGLSISHDIIVKQHGGSVEVDTHPGEFTEIRVILPRTCTPALLSDRA